MYADPRKRIRHVRSKEEERDDEVDARMARELHHELNGSEEQPHDSGDDFLVSPGRRSGFSEPASKRMRRVSSYSNRVSNSTTPRESGTRYSLRERTPMKQYDSDGSGLTGLDDSSQEEASESDHEVGGAISGSDAESEEASSRYHFRDRSKTKARHFSPDRQGYVKKTRDYGGNVDDKELRDLTAKQRVSRRRKKIQSRKRKGKKSRKRSSSRAEPKIHLSDFEFSGSGSSDSDSSKSSSDYSSTSDSDNSRKSRRKRNARKKKDRRPDDLTSPRKFKRGDQGGSSVDPVSIDPSITWDSIGGLDEHIRVLREMVLLPLLYPQLFERFRCKPPRGVLFYGPPGTGKTLTARALCNACRGADHDVAFFMKKGADCMSKYVGESERQLRLLFEEAKRCQPSIIFFDEIDGLAPARSSRQDYIHASIVSTLLALMDGLDDRGQVIVIGATNRPDTLDPALRRPGRFDKELLFSLPTRDSRRSILGIHTQNWEQQMDEELLDTIADRTVGFGGADLKALCTEAALAAVRRVYPQIYESSVRYQIRPTDVEVFPEDFWTALSKMQPASQRSANKPGRPLPHRLKPLFNHQLDVLKALVHSRCRFVDFSHDKASTSTGHSLNGPVLVNPSVQFRMLIKGEPDEGLDALARALVFSMEKVTILSLEIGEILTSVDYGSVERAIAEVVRQAVRNQPCVLFWPKCDTVWNILSPEAQIAITAIFDEIPLTSSVAIISTVSTPEMRSLPFNLVDCLSSGGKVNIREHDYLLPEETQLHAFFLQLIHEATQKLVASHRPPAHQVRLRKAPARRNSQKQTRLLAELHKREEAAEQVYRQLRIELRLTVDKISRHHQFKDFNRMHLGGEEVGLYQILKRINEGTYKSVQEFISDIKEIVQYVTEDADEHTDEGVRIVSRVNAMLDACLCSVYELPSKFLKKLHKMNQRINELRESIETPAEPEQRLRPPPATTTIDASGVVSYKIPLQPLIPGRRQSSRLRGGELPESVLQLDNLADSRVRSEPPSVDDRHDEDASAPDHSAPEDGSADESDRHSEKHLAAEGHEEGEDAQVDNVSGDTVSENVEDAAEGGHGRETGDNVEDEPYVDDAMDTIENEKGSPLQSQMNEPESVDDSMAASHHSEDDHGDIAEDEARNEAVPSKSAVESVLDRCCDDASLVDEICHFCTKAAHRKPTRAVLSYGYAVLEHMTSAAYSEFDLQHLERLM